MKSLTQMLSLRMDEQKTEQLKTMLGICQELGAETRYYPEHRYFTAMVWTGWDTPCGMGEALPSNRKFKEQPLSTRPSCATASTHSAHWSTRSEPSM